MTVSGDPGGRREASRSRAPLPGTAPTPIATIQMVGDEAGPEQCSFCGKRRDQVAAMASAGDRRDASAARGVRAVSVRLVGPNAAQGELCLVSSAAAGS
jgi:hypothetical protein